jgi:hypothetical protein
VPKPSKRAYLLNLLERAIQIQALQTQPETFEALIAWIKDRLEHQPKKRRR